MNYANGITNNENEENDRKVGAAKRIAPERIKNCSLAIAKRLFGRRKLKSPPPIDFGCGSAAFATAQVWHLANCVMLLSLQPRFGTWPTV
ncbi:hypothetical protein AVEN_63068-1 [Araneus ventricosus]|uniref:Uncharacterized protein n=1 Tax=Araneus ventricosus TaxID=182803 RepID=A0A4Y2V8Z2_ARAVE|nr:hypothetical protein AVEN_63068-1 [Araneus ventricosus]